VNPDSSSSTAPNGPRNGVDVRGQASRDPTENVLDLVAAETKRQDDLRLMESTWRDKLDVARSYHAKEIRKAETDRIDAIRAVDVGNVQRAAEVAATQASILENRVSESAETLRKQVADTAIQMDAKLAGVIDPIQKRLDDLTRAQYETVGQKTQVAEGRADTTERRGGVSNTTTIIASVVGAIALMLALYAAVRTTRPAATTPTPIIVTTPTVTTPAP
jgi:hypothetical protein